MDPYSYSSLGALGGILVCGATWFRLRGWGVPVGRSCVVGRAASRALVRGLVSTNDFLHLANRSSYQSASGTAQRQWGGARACARWDK